MKIFLTSQRASEYTGGYWINENPAIVFTQVIINAVSEGCLLFPESLVRNCLEQDKDIQKEILRRVHAGIGAIVLDNQDYAKGIAIPVLIVDNIFEAFEAIAGKVRQDANPTTILVTGTEGKTGTKIQLHHLLKEQVNVHAVLNSGNGVFPVLSSLANIRKNDVVEITEVAIDRYREKSIRRSKVVNPDIVFYANISTEHMHVHHTLQNLLQAKASAIEGMRANGRCVVNSSILHYEDFADALRERRTNVTILTYGNKKNDTARLISKNFDLQKLGWHVEANIDGEEVRYFLPLCQQHAPLMSVGTLLVVKMVGCDVWKAAQRYVDIKPFESMGNIYRLPFYGGEVLFYDQSRRSSIAGIRSAFEDLRTMSHGGRIIGLVGSVSSVKDNEWTEKFHVELASLINNSTISRLYTTGPNMNYVHDCLVDQSVLVKHSDDHDELYENIVNDLQEGDLLFIMGYMRLYLDDIAKKIIVRTPLRKIDDIHYPPAISREMVVIRKAKASQLAIFFEKLDRKIESRYGVHCINDSLKKRYSSLIHNEIYCYRWFNNSEKIAGLLTHGIFGSFFDFNDRQYLLMVILGTFNLHIGFIKYQQNDDGYVFLKMEDLDYQVIKNRYAGDASVAQALRARSWGYKPMTIDCGNLIDSSTENICSLLLADESSLFTRYLTPFFTSVNRVQWALRSFALFDSKQLFRFFVDGRFHKKYRGWVGYEKNESGSVQGILDAYCLMLDNFDLATGLTSIYIKNLHASCMAGVITKNKKSTPGDLRYLEAGLNLYHDKSTLASLREIIEQRSGEGGMLFHSRQHQGTVESFTADEVLRILKEDGRIRFRTWYPNLDEEQQRKLIQPKSLGEFYEVKHYIQMCFAQRFDHLVERYNQEVAAARMPDHRLVAISRIVRDLELLHPFPDGNGRTLVAVLMNHLLLANGFLPAILWDPNIDAELSVLEFADEIRRGMKNTEMLLRDPSVTLYDYAISEATKEEILAFQKLSEPLLSRLQALAFGTGVDVAEEDGKGAKRYLPLTPGRLVAITGGVWLHIDSNVLEKLRFEGVTITGGEGENQLYFCRHFSNWKAERKNPEEEFERQTACGVVAVVVAERELAKKTPLPVLLVPDVDKALYEVGRAMRGLVNCQVVAVVGTEWAAKARELLCRVGRAYFRVHVAPEGDGKTPHVMGSLANLRLSDQVEVIEVATGARTNVARYRLQAIAPDVCFFTSCDNVEGLKETIYTDVLKTLAACVEGLRPGGLCLVNSASPSSPRLVQEIQGRSVAMRTFGFRKEDNARFLQNPIFDPQSGLWSVQAVVMEKRLEYCLSGEDGYLPLLSLGVLLCLQYLGCDIENVAATLAN